MFEIRVLENDRFGRCEVFLPVGKREYRLCLQDMGSLKVSWRSANGIALKINGFIQAGDYNAVNLMLNAYPLNSDERRRILRAIKEYKV